MRALKLSVDKCGTRRLRYDGDYPTPKPTRGEALLRVTLAAICGTDLQLVEGYKSHTDTLVLGHEFVGVVAAYGPPSGPSDGLPPLGTRVVAEINCVCALANESEKNKASPPAHTPRDRAQHPRRTALGIFGRDGTFADYVTVPAVNLHIVPDGIRDAQAVFAEPVAAACNILEEVPLPTRARVAVLGAGRLGLIVASVLAAAGKNVALITRRATSSIPRDCLRWGPLPAHVVPVFSLTGEDGPELSDDEFDAVVDCTGDPSALSTAVRLTRPRGTVILKSTVAKPALIDLSPVVIKELTMKGSRCGPFDVALRFLLNGFLNVEGLICAIYSIEDGEAAFEKAKQPGALKILLQFP